MPNRYKNRWLPEVLYTHTLDWLVGFTLLFSAAAVVFGGRRVLPAVISSLPDFLAWVYLIFLVLGGISILTGLFGIKYFWSAGFLRSGMWFGATAFLAYGFLLGLTVVDGAAPGAVLASVLFLFLAAGCAIRAHGIGIDTAANLKILQALNATARRERREEDNR